MPIHTPAPISIHPSVPMSVCMSAHMSAHTSVHMPIQFACAFDCVLHRVMAKLWCQFGSERDGQVLARMKKCAAATALMQSFQPAFSGVNSACDLQPANCEAKEYKMLAHSYQPARTIDKGWLSPALPALGHMCVCVCVHVCACVRARALVCLRACVFVCVPCTWCMLQRLNHLERNAGDEAICHMLYACCMLNAACSRAFPGRGHVAGDRVVDRSSVTCVSSRMDRSNQIR